MVPSVSGGRLEIRSFRVALHMSIDIDRFRVEVTVGGRLIVFPVVKNDFAVASTNSMARFNWL